MKQYKQNPFFKNNYKLTGKVFVSRLFIPFLCLLHFLTAESVFSEIKPDFFRVTSQEMTDTSISDLLYSNFIELGYGLQVEPMWGEMLFNRSFEEFYPYRDINIFWFDLWLNEEDPKKGYKTDWSREDWYHSGYEHNPWFACPGKDTQLPIDENSTFIIPKSTELNVTIAGFNGGCGHGKQCIQITNNESVKWGGMAQGGKLLKKGKTYKFRGLLKKIKGSGIAEIRIYPKNNWIFPITVIPLKTITDSFETQSVEFYNPTYEGWAVFSLWIGPNSKILADDFSLMPEDTINGWRPEVIEAAKRVHPGVVRFPGGCFASFYNWHDGIGPHEKRQPQPSYFWGGLNYNDVGIDELGSFCNAIGAKMMYCVNVYHPLKQKYDHFFNEKTHGSHGRDLPQFADIEAGAKEAANLVAYCNLPVGSHPMADLRAQNGHLKPFGIEFWEMDNEIHRWYTPTEYAKVVVLYSKMMKAIDPSIKIGLVTYGERPELHLAYHEKLPEMLEIAGKHIDFLADRRDAEEGLIHMLDILRDYNTKNITNIKYCETEWLAYEGIPDVQNRYKYEGHITKCFMFSKWYYAMNIFKNYMAWQQQGGDVLFVNFNNFANTHSQSVIETPKEGAYLTASGKVFELLSRSPAAWPLYIEKYTSKVSDEYQVQAAWNKDRTQLVLYIVNRTDQDHQVVFDFSILNRTFRYAEKSELSADSPFTMNTLKSQNAIKRNDQIIEANVTKQYSINVQKYSFTQIVLR